MSDVQNVTYAKPKVGGAAFYAPIGTTLPTDATSALDPAFIPVGYISEDGLVNSNSPETENIKAWGGDIVLTTLTEKADTFTFTLIESANENVLKCVYGEDNVTVNAETGEITVAANSTTLPEYAWVFDMRIKGGKARRIVCPDASISELGDISYTDADATGYETTISALPDATGNTHYEYIEK